MFSFWKELWLTCRNSEALSNKILLAKQLKQIIGTIREKVHKILETELALSILSCIIRIANFATRMWAWNRFKNLQLLCKWIIILVVLLLLGRRLLISVVFQLYFGPQWQDRIRLISVSNLHLCCIRRFSQKCTILSCLYINPYFNYVICNLLLHVFTLFVI